MTKLCNTCEYLKYCARSGIEDVGCDRYKMDTTTNEEWFCRNNEIANLPKSNIEWMREASIYEMAEFIVNLTLLDKYKLYDRMESAEYEQGIGVGAKKVIVEWLKEIHHG